MARSTSRCGKRWPSRATGQGDRRRVGDVELAAADAHTGGVAAAAVIRRQGGGGGAGLESLNAVISDGFNDFRVTVAELETVRLVNRERVPAAILEQGEIVEVVLAVFFPGIAIRMSGADSA